MTLRLIIFLAALVPVLALFGLLIRNRPRGLSLGRRLSIFLLDLGAEVGALTLDAADAVLKEDYIGPVREQLNNGNLILAQLERNTKDFHGRRFVQALHVGRNRGVGARGERQTLPDAGNQRYENIFGPVRSMYARIELTGQTIEAMAKDTGSFIRALRPEMDGAMTDAKRDYCRQVWNTSDGVIATCGSTTTSTTIVLATTTGGHQMRWLEEGFVVDILDVSNSNALLTPADGVVVLSVNQDAKTLVIGDVDGTSAATISTSVGDLIVRHSAYGVTDNSGNPNDGQYELTGMQTIVDDSATLHTLAPSTEPRWKSRVYGNSGTDRAISESLVTRALMDTETRTGEQVDLLVGSGGVFRAYSNPLIALKRFNDTLELKGGYEAVKVGTAGAGRKAAGKSLGLTWDWDCPDKSLFGLTLSSFDFFELADWQWMDKHGAVLVQVGDTDAYSATLKKYGELGNHQRTANFRIEDITEDA